jgi:hypothetical protein
MYMLPYFESIRMQKQAVILNELLLEYLSKLIDIYLY